MSGLTRITLYIGYCQSFNCLFCILRSVHGLDSSPYYKERVMYIIINNERESPVPISRDLKGVLFISYYVMVEVYLCVLWLVVYCIFNLPRLLGEDKEKY